MAAVGNSYEITLIFIAFAFGCNIGCSVIVSRYFGAKEYDDMKTSVYTALIGSAVLCAALMVFGLLGCRSLLELINTPEEILADSALYLDIYVLGLPFMFFYNIATGIFSALGDSMNDKIDTIVAGVNRKDEKMWGDFYDRFYAALCVYVSKILPVPDAVEDLVQDVFISVWEGKRTLKKNIKTRNTSISNNIIGTKVITNQNISEA